MDIKDLVTLFETTQKELQRSTNRAIKYISYS